MNKFYLSRLLSIIELSGYYLLLLVFIILLKVLFLVILFIKFSLLSGSGLLGGSILDIVFSLVF